MSIKHKMIGGLLLAVLLPMVAMLFINQHLMKGAIRTSYQEKIGSGIQRTLERTIPGMEAAAANYVTFLGNDSNLQQAAYYAVAIGKSTDIMPLLDKYAQQLQLSFMDVLDLKGKVLFSTASERVGLQLQVNSDTVKQAGSGMVTTLRYADEAKLVLLETTAAITRKGSVIGLLTGGYRFDTAQLTGLAGKELMAIFGPRGELAAATVKMGAPSQVAELLATLKTACAQDAKGKACLNPSAPLHEAELGSGKAIYTLAPIRDTAHSLVGVLLVGMDASAMEAELSSSRTTSSLLTALFTLLAAGLGWVIATHFTTTITQIGHNIQVIAGGQLQQRIPIPARPDELGSIGIHVNAMAESLSRIIKGIGLQADTLTAIVAESQRLKLRMRADSTAVNDHSTNVVRTNDQIDQETFKLKSGIEQVADSIDAIRVRSDELSMSMHTIAAATEQANQNVTTVAAAAEEMAALITGVNHNLERVKGAVREVDGSITELNRSQQQVRAGSEAASKESERATRHVQESTRVMAGLANATQEIGKVVAMINSIAEQTNMLALNASIEAAGAGEAGKGFAVVASEVKELARQTAQATKLISKQVNEIRTSAEGVGTAVGEIQNIIAQVARTNQEISQAATDQDQVVKRISSAIQGVSNATDEVSHSAGEMENAATEVARATSEASTGTREIARSAAAAATSARQITQSIHQAHDSSRVVRQLGMTLFEESAKVQKLGLEVMDLARFLEQTVTLDANLTTTIAATSQALNRSREGLEIGPARLDVGAIKQGLLALELSLHHQASGRRGEEFALSQGAANSPPWGAADSPTTAECATIRAELDDLYRKLHGVATELVTTARQGAAVDRTKLATFVQLRERIFTELDRFYLA